MSRPKNESAVPGAPSEERDAGTPSRRNFLATALTVGGASLAASKASAAAASLAGGTAPALPESLLAPLMENRLTREYGLRVPFVGAGMGFVAMPELVAAVSNAGGMGVIGNAIELVNGTQSLIEQVKQKTKRPFGVDFLVDDSAFGPMTTDAHIDLCIGEQVKLVVFHANLPPKAWVDRLKANRVRVWAQVESVEKAIAAAHLGVDAVIAQGSEAGGHNRSKTPLRVLLPAIIRAVHPIMVLAAGGISDGESAFRAMAAGADGVWVGTRLVASREGYAHAAYKARLVAAGKDATVNTTMFGPEYPDRPYRVLRNRVVNEWAGKEAQIPNPPPPPAVIGQTMLFARTAPLPYSMPKFSAIVPTPETVGDFEEMGLPAGAGVEAIHDIPPAAQIVASMMFDACERLRLAGLLR